jgi:uncharacterized protein (UPF0332 family)
MEYNKQDLIKHSFEKSNIAFNDAEFALDNNKFYIAQNRIYYAIFYSVMALGYFHDFITSKHSSLLSWFNRKFVYEDKIFDKKLFRIYKESFENRKKSDYEFTWKPDLINLKKDLEDAKVFISKVKEHLGANL